MSLLTGSNSFTSVSDITFESKAVRTAKALFTLTQDITPPWKEAVASTPLSSQVSTIKAMKTIIDKAGTGADLLNNDVQTTFTAYKALDRLRVLAESASAKTMSDAQRATLQTSFAKGLTDIQTFLASAPSDVVNLAFNQPLRYMKSAEISNPSQYSVPGKGLVKNRTDAIPGLTGQEKFTVNLTKDGTTANDTVTVDLSTGPQPPTVDSLTEMLNAAIKAVPNRMPDGTIITDTNGDPVSRYTSRFEVTREDGFAGKWGLTLNASSGIERVTMGEIGAKDSIMVATGQTALDAPTATSVFRINDPAGDATRKTLGSISALNSAATAQATLAGKTTTITTTSTDIDGKVITDKTTTSNVYADTDAAQVVVDGQGNSYIVGTTAGDLGANKSDGDDNLFLTKLNGEGKVVWQRSLGAGGSSTGVAVTLAPDGNVVVAGTVTGAMDGANTDGDMFVTKFATNGDEKFSTVVRATGADTAKAVAVGADGSIYVGGRSATGGGDAFVAKINASGKLVERSTIADNGSGSINGLAVDASGNVLALVQNNGNAEVHKLSGTALSTELGSISLGTADARAIAIGPDGSIAVGGATSSTLSGSQVNANSGGRDGFVARIDGGLSGSSVTYIGSSEDDQVDSIAFMNGSLYAGGRTKGTIGEPLKGAVDGFVTRIDASTGAIGNTTQFGSSALRTEPVRIAADNGGGSVVSSIGFARGTINPATSAKLTTQTGLRVGDSFSIKVDDGTVRKITIGADDTLKTIADRISGITGSKAKTTTPTISGKQTLRVDTKAGHSIEFLAGPAGSDALAKLGIDPQRIETPETQSANAPKVKPGGTFGLMLSEALNVKTVDDAKIALKKLESAVSMSQTAYRSLYWDDAKATMVDGVKNTATGKGSTAREQAQLANYQAALTRLNSSTSTLIGF
ncbi:hypothetical protein AB2M62_02225 [Sphingomonas sp. MMS12-HWE2-04]|uniref:hypothetical protein n=1 Tax=Sphingomonas sp. MMS12-HWE2-04 TaxID=3234199 RepID=UPI00384F18A2